MSNVESKKRTDDEIIYLILDICKDGTLRTNIIQGGKLNYSTVNHYLNILVKNDLITELGYKPTTMFKITSKGLKFKKMLIGLHSEIDDSWNPVKS